MIFKYYSTAKPEAETVDTDSPDFRQACEYICKVTGATRWQVIAVSIGYQPGIPDTITGGTRMGARGEVFFEGLPSSRVPGFDKFQQDALDVFARPYVAALCIIKDANLPIKDVPKYVDPDSIPAPAQEDWQVAGSPIGPPLAAWPGLFDFKWTKHKFGDTHTGLSGTKYQLVLAPTAHFPFPAWKAN